MVSLVSLFVMLLLAANSRLLIYSLILSRGPDSEGEWREHHWEDLLASHSLDPEQVRSPSFNCMVHFKGNVLHSERA